MPSTGITVDNTFAGQGGSNVPASELDQNFAQPVAALNTLQTFGNYFVDDGAANEIGIGLPSPLIASFAFDTFIAGLPFQIQVIAANTGNTTITVAQTTTGDITAPLVYPSGSQLLPGQLSAGGVISVMFDGANFEYLGPIFGKGSFTGTLTSGANTSTGTCYFSVLNSFVSLYVTYLTVAASGGGLSLNGLPAYLAPPTRTVLFPIPLAVNNGSVIGTAIGTIGAAGSEIVTYSSATAVSSGGGAWTGTVALGVPIPPSFSAAQTLNWGLI
jgi:hypothetical protein